MTREKAALFYRRKQAFTSSWRKPSHKSNETARVRDRMGRGESPGLQETRKKMTGRVKEASLVPKLAPSFPRGS